LRIFEGYIREFLISIFADFLLIDVCSGRGLLGGDKLRIVDEAVLVLVVGLQDRVDHVLQLFVLEDLGLGHRFPGFVVMV